MQIKVKKRYIGAIISIILLFFIFQKMDFQKIWQHLQQFNLKNLLLVIPIYFTGYILRAKRWKNLMLDLPQLKIGTLMGITFIGYAVNCFMPARAGDFYRAHLTGNTFDISRVSVVSSILLERILDGIVVFGFLILVMIFFYHQPWLYHVAFTSGAIFLGIFCFIYWTIKFGNIEDLFRKITVLCKKYGLPTIFVNKMRKGTKYVSSFINGFEVLNHPKLLLNSVFLTIGVWGVETIFLFVIINGFGIHLGYSTAVFLLCLTVFSSMVPSLSVHTGPYQCAFILALDAFGVNKEMAIAMAFVTQIIIISFVSITGLFYMLRYHIKINQIQQDFNKQDSVDTIELEP